MRSPCSDPDLTTLQHHSISTAPKSSPLLFNNSLSHCRKAFGPEDPYTTPPPASRRSRRRRARGDDGGNGDDDSSSSGGEIEALFASHASSLPRRYAMDRLSPVLATAPSKLAVFDVESRPPRLLHTSRMKHMHAPAALHRPSTAAWSLRLGAGVPLQI